MESAPALEGLVPATPVAAPRAPVSLGATTTDGLGHGLVGVRERVKIYGGEMTAAPAADGGFVLSTRLPLVRERA